MDSVTEIGDELIDLVFRHILLPTFLSDTMME